MRVAVRRATSSMSSASVMVPLPDGDGGRDNRKVCA